MVPQFFYLIHERIFQEIAKRGALTKKVFKSLVAFNRGLRKVGDQRRSDSVQQSP